MSRLCKIPVLRWRCKIEQARKGGIRMKKYAKCYILFFGIIFLCSACGKNSQNKEENIIKEFFSEIYSITAEDYDTFSNLDFLDESAVEEFETWMKEKYAGYLTEHGFECAMRNNIIIQGFKQYQENGETEAKISNILLEKKESGEKYWYEYKIILDTKSEIKEAEGILFFSTDETDKIEKITK